MDQFVVGKLTEWGLEECIEVFKENKITEERLLLLTAKDITELIKPVGLRASLRKHLAALKREQKSGKGGGAQPSTSGTRSGDAGKRKQKTQKHQEGASYPPKRPRDSALDEKLEAVKGIMAEVLDKQPDNSDVDKFLREKITDLNTERKELVGVFGRTGTGKSSLINTVIGEKDLLPTGDIEACTSVIIKVEANTETQKYMAEVEFISKEEFSNEMDFLRPYFGRTDCENEEYEAKLTALFGDEWTTCSLDELKESKRYKDILKKLESNPFRISHPTAKSLNKEIVKFTKDKSTEDKTKTWYWPVVKCVTIKVPDNELLRHVTLVDLPGTGDCNKTRNDMWKEMVSCCGTVWVAAEPTRAVSDRDAWEIIESACKYLGNGGECRNIHFICTKLDKERTERSVDDMKSFIERLKTQVHMKCDKTREFKSHFSKDCFKVFTVSSKDFLKNTFLQPEQNEIPKLQAELQTLNSQHKQTHNYVSAAYGILSLMKGARNENVQQMKKVHKILTKNGIDGITKINTTTKKLYSDFSQRLTAGVETAKSSCEDRVKKIIIEKKRGGAFHQTLRSVVEKKGVHKPKKGKEINLNTALSSFLTGPIDSDFRTAFPNDQKSGLFHKINSFSLNTEQLIQEYEDSKLVLIFFEKEEEQLKTRLCREILERKKSIYNSLTETIEKHMEPCYSEAAKAKGEGSLQKMRNIIMNHVQKYKDSMFDDAKTDMLNELKKLEENIDKNLSETCNKILDLGLGQHTVAMMLPDISDEFMEVEKLYNELGS